jgi:hypothetical protein
MPFFPAGWWVGLAVVAGALTAFSARAGLAFALAVPLLPLGNYAAGLALAYAAVAALWLALTWREPRTSLFVALGPLLGPMAALGFLPLAAQVVRNPVRRAAQVAVAVLAASATASLSDIDKLGIRGAGGPSTAARALWGAAASHPAVPLEAAALAVAALLLPLCRTRGAWGAGAFGAALLTLAVLPTDGPPAISLVFAAVASAGLLAAEPHIRLRH